MRAQMLTTIWLGLFLTGCQGQDVPVAAQPPGTICAGYGLDVNTTTFSDCVAYQESRAQTYPSLSVPPYRLDQYNNRVDAAGYQVDSMGRRMPVQSPYYLPLRQASSSQPILRDEYGNRYDARGNRIK